MIWISALYSPYLISMVELVTIKFALILSPLLMQFDQLTSVGISSVIQIHNSLRILYQSIRAPHKRGLQNWFVFKTHESSDKCVQRTKTYMCLCLTLHLWYTIDFNGLVICVQSSAGLSRCKIGQFNTKFPIILKTRNYS